MPKKEVGQTMHHDESADQEKIRVVMVAACPFPANHGTPGAIRELAMKLAALGHEVHIVTYPQSEDIPTDGLHIHRVNVPWMKPGPVTIGPSFERIIYDMFLVPKLIQVVKKYNIDVIHAHNYEANIAGAMAKWVTRKPLIYNGVTSFQDELPSYGVIKPEFLARKIGWVFDWVVPRLSDVIMVLSDELKDYLVGLGNPEKKVLVVPPGVEMEWLSSGNGSKVIEKLGIESEQPIVLYTGALEYFQRIDYLLQAMSLVFKEDSESILVIAANVNNEDALSKYQAMATQMGIEKRIIFVKSMRLEELPDYLDAATVTVVPRPSCPGYPIKLLNYMSAGKPIVSFSGSAKALVHGYSGYIAADHDVTDLANGIGLLLRDNEASRILGENAVNSLEGVFDWTTIARGIADVYLQLKYDRRKFSLSTLSRYLKKSYTPELVDRKKINDFIVEGKLVYPAISES